jgi:hypothetical protein
MVDKMNGKPRPFPSVLKEKSCFVLPKVWRVAYAGFNLEEKLRVSLSDTNGHLVSLPGSLTVQGICIVKGSNKPASKHEQDIKNNELRNLFAFYLA